MKSGCLVYHRVRMLDKSEAVKNTDMAKEGLVKQITDIWWFRLRCRLNVVACDP